MVLVRFEYLRSDSERKLLIGQFDLTHVRLVELESSDIFENRPRLPTGREGMSMIAQNWGKIFQRWKSGHCKDTESNLGPFAGF